MGIALHFHIAFQVHGAGAGHPAQVVAAQVHQHDVLGALLGVVVQFGGQAGVFQIVGPAPARARNGRKLQLPRRATHHDLRRGSQQGDFRKAHIKHVGRSVKTPHAPVELKGIAREGGGKTHRRHHLDGLALAEHLLDAAHKVLVALFAGFGADGLRVQQGALPRFAGLQGLPCPLQGTVIAQAYLAKAVVEMVKNQDRGGQHKLAVRLFRRHKPGQLGVEQSGHAEAQIAVKGTGNGRQVGHIGRRRDVHGPHERAQALHKGAACKLLQPCEALVQHGEFQVAVTAGNEQCGVAGQNAVAAPTAVHLGAFQQNAVVLPHHAHKQTDGRIHVRRQPAGGLLQRDFRLRVPLVVHLRLPSGCCKKG